MLFKPHFPKYVDYFLSEEITTKQIQKASLLYREAGTK